MNLEAVVKNPSDRNLTIGRAIVKPFELAVKTGYHAIHAANPFRDAKEFAKGLQGLVTEEKSWKEYKDGLKEGKFLGKWWLDDITLFEQPEVEIQFDVLLKSYGQHVGLGIDAVEDLLIGQAEAQEFRAVRGSLGRGLRDRVQQMALVPLFLEGGCDVGQANR